MAYKQTTWAYESHHSSSNGLTHMSRNSSNNHAIASQNLVNHFGITIAEPKQHNPESKMSCSG